jgi:hypothetical protein
MWKLLNGRLIHMTDESRVKFRTNISQSVIESLKKLAADNDTHVNYLIESGLKAVLADGNITFNKHMRPNDRIQYKTTYDKELLIQLKEFAKNHNLYINDVIEFSIQHIDIKQSKDMSYRYRVE